MRSDSPGSIGSRRNRSGGEWEEDGEGGERNVSPNQEISSPWPLLRGLLVAVGSNAKGEERKERCLTHCTTSSTKRSEECRRSARAAARKTRTAGRLAFAVCCPTLPAAAGTGFTYTLRSGGPGSTPLSASCRGGRFLVPSPLRPGGRREAGEMGGGLPVDILSLILRGRSLNISIIIQQRKDIPCQNLAPLHMHNASALRASAGRAAVRSQTKIRHPNANPCRGCSSIRPRGANGRVLPARGIPACGWLLSITNGPNWSDG